MTPNHLESSSDEAMHEAKPAGWAFVLALIVLFGKSVV